MYLNILIPFFIIGVTDITTGNSRSALRLYSVVVNNCSFPLTTKDTSRLAGRFLKTFPVEPSIVKEGKIIVLPDSNDYWKNIAIIAGNKKAVIVKELKTQYVDTCLSAFDRFEEGFNNGFDVGFADAKSKCPQSTKQVDTFTQDKPQTTAQLFLLNNNVSDLKNKLAIVSSKYLENKENQRSLKWSLLHLFTFWQIWVLVLFFAGGIWIFRKPLLNRLT